MEAEGLGVGEFSPRAVERFLAERQRQGYVTRRAQERLGRGLPCS